MNPSIFSLALVVFVHVGAVFPSVAAEADPGGFAVFAERAANASGSEQMAIYAEWEEAERRLAEDLKTTPTLIDPIFPRLRKALESEGPPRSEINYFSQVWTFAFEHDEDRALSLVGEILTDPNASLMQKSMVFDKALSGRRIELVARKQLERLHTYDQKLMCLLDPLLTPDHRIDGLDAESALRYVQSLVGREIPLANFDPMPPMDRECGLALARQLISQEQSIYRFYYYDILIRYVPSLRDRLMDELVKFVDDQDLSIWERATAAEIIEKNHGPISPERVAELKALTRGERNGKRPVSQSFSVGGKNGKTIQTTTWRHEDGETIRTIIERENGRETIRVETVDEETPAP